jgi:hypothetical protein
MAAKIANIISNNSTESIFDFFEAGCNKKIRGIINIKNIAL